jgi:molecular chaperone DnaJ
LFQRQGDDLILDRVISFPLAALGGVVSVPTLEGEVDLTVPAGTQPGAVLRLRGKGMPRLRGKSRGDMLVRLNVRVPTRLSPEEKELLMQLGVSEGEELSDGKSFFKRFKDAVGGKDD